MKLTHLITLAALVGTCAIATAQDKPARPKRPIPKEVLEKYDTDKDGDLSAEERAPMLADRKAAEEKRKAAALKLYDKDGDGKLSEDERKTMREGMEATRKAFMEKYDTDKNGKLEPAEKKVAIDAGEEIPPGRGPRRPHDAKGRKDAPENGGEDKPNPPDI